MSGANSFKNDTLCAIKYAMNEGIEVVNSPYATA